MYKITVPTVITNGHFNKEKTLAELKRCKADRVALAVERELDCAFSSDKNLTLLSSLIGYFEENGIETMVWIGETFGHDGGNTSGVSKYRNIRHTDGREIKAFCPTDENFVNDMCVWIQNITKCGAKTIMLDDDFRLGYRSGLGCSCDAHMKMFEEELGEKIPRERVESLIFDGGKNKFRTAWLNVQKKSMESFARKLRNAVDEINPDVRLGFCASPCAWDQEGWYAPDMARIMAGKTKPFLRTIGAPYWIVRMGGMTLAKVAEIERTQLTFLERYKDIEVFTEGDTYPRPRHECPSSYLECFDTIMRADGRSDGILKYMFDYVSDADYETGYVDSMVKNENLYKEIEELFKGKNSIGVRPYNVPRLFEDADLDINRRNIMNEILSGLFYPSIDFAVENSLPTVYEKGAVNIVFGENARHISEKDLKNGNILDIVAAKILSERGIDVGLKEILPFSASKQTGFTDLPSEFHLSAGVYTRLDGCAVSNEIITDDNAEIISQYCFGEKRICGSYKFENDRKMRFLVYNFNAIDAARSNGWIASYAKRREILKSITWLSGQDFEVYPDGNYPRLYTMIKKDESSVAVGLWNLFDDKIDNLKVKYNIPISDVRFINCNGHIEGDNIFLDGTLYPYEFAGIEIKTHKEKKKWRK